MALRAFDINWCTGRNDGGRVAYTRNSGSNVLRVDFGAPERLPQGTADLLSFLDDFDSDPATAAHLHEARRDIGGAFEAIEGLTIRALRLRLGMSQADLADKLQTSQAAVSSIENRIRKPGEETIRDLSRVLMVDFNTLMEALDHG